MARKEIKQIIDKNGEIHKISLDLEQKIKNGYLLPDYELSQKRVHNFGSVILQYFTKIDNDGIDNIQKYCQGNWYNGEAHNIFQTTFDSTIEQDGEYYILTVSVNSMNFKTNLKLSNPIGSIININEYKKYVNVNFETENILNECQYFNYQSNSWVDCNNNDYLIGPNRTSRVYFTNKGLFKLRCKTEWKLQTLSSYGIKTYNSINLISIPNYGRENHFLRRGIFFSKKNQWYYISIPSLENICVKKGGNKFVNDDMSIYKLTYKNTCYTAFWRGITNDRYGYSKQHTDNGYSINKQGFRWHTTGDPENIIKIYPSDTTSGKSVRTNIFKKINKTYYSWLMRYKYHTDDTDKKLIAKTMARDLSYDDKQDLNVPVSKYYMKPLYIEVVIPDIENNKMGLFRYNIYINSYELYDSGSYYNNIKITSIRKSLEFIKNISIESFGGINNHTKLRKLNENNKNYVEYL